MFTDSKLGQSLAQLELVSDLLYFYQDIFYTSQLHVAHYNFNKV